MAAYLELIIGPMFCGKTSFLINKYKQLNYCNIPVLVVNHSLDNRYSNIKLSNHDQEMIECEFVDSLGELFKDGSAIHSAYIEANVILINEGQFFNDLKFYVLRMLEDGKHVYIAGLDSDFKKHKFGEIIDLIPICDNIKKLSSLCSLCRDGTKAIFSHRISDEQEQTLVGSTNYIPLCRKCHSENNK